MIPGDLLNTSAPSNKTFRLRRADSLQIDKLRKEKNYNNIDILRGFYDLGA